MRSLLLVPLALLLACPSSPAGDDDDSGPPPDPTLPEVVPTEWVEEMRGTIEYEKTYTSGALEGQTCTEVFTIEGANITDFAGAEPCVQCDLVFELFISLDPESDCAGDHDLEEGQIGFDLRQESSEVVLWYYSEGVFGWGAGWNELTQGELQANDDAVQLEVSIAWDDPDNDAQFGGNRATDDPCGWFGDACEFQGAYTIDAAFRLDEAQVEWEDGE